MGDEKDITEQDDDTQGNYMSNVADAGDDEDDTQGNYMSNVSDAGGDDDKDDSEGNAFR